MSSQPWLPSRAVDPQRTTTGSTRLSGVGWSYCPVMRHSTSVMAYLYVWTRAYHTLCNRLGWATSDLAPAPVHAASRLQHQLRTIISCAWLCIFSVLHQLGSTCPEPTISQMAAPLGWDKHSHCCCSHDWCSFGLLAQLPHHIKEVPGWLRHLQLL